MFFDLVFGLVVVSVLLTVVSLPFVIWGTTDAAQRPEWVWYRAAQNRALWIGMMVGGLFWFGPVGGFIAVWYLASVRPKLDAAQQAGPPPFPYGVRAADLPPPGQGPGYFGSTGPDSR